MKTMTALQAAFAQMAQTEPGPATSRYKITLFATADLQHFTAIANKVGTHEYDTPDDALQAAIGNHTRMTGRRRRAATLEKVAAQKPARELPNSLKRAIGFAKRQTAKRTLPNSIKGALASPVTKPQPKAPPAPSQRRAREGKHA